MMFQGLPSFPPPSPLAQARCFFSPRAAPGELGSAVDVPWRSQRCFSFFVFFIYPRPVSEPYVCMCEEVVVWVLFWRV